MTDAMGMPHAVQHEAGQAAEAWAAQWERVTGLVTRAQRASMHCSLASVDADGRPNVAPIGTVFLTSPGRGHFFDRYAEGTGRNLAIRPEICLMAVDSRRSYWIRALVSGRFGTPPGVRLDGVAGPLRQATDEEVSALELRLLATRWTRGHRLLWSSFTHVRDLNFTRLRPVTYPAMMEHCWQ